MNSNVECFTCVICESTVSVDIDEQKQKKINPLYARVTCPALGCPLFKCLHCNMNFSAKRLFDKSSIEKHVGKCYFISVHNAELEVHNAELEIAARMSTAVQEPDEELDFGSGDGGSFVDQE